MGKGERKGETQGTCIMHYDSNREKERDREWSQIYINHACKNKDMAEV